MKPEFSAYQNAPHSRVECVECHVAPGAAGWIASKTSGIRQLILTVSNREPKPVPPALESNRLVPARETCENCHWPDMRGLLNPAERACASSPNMPTTSATRGPTPSF